MRNFEERRAEVLRRGAEGKKRRKAALKATVGTVSVFALCCCIFAAYNFGNTKSEGRIDGFDDELIEAGKNEAGSPSVSEKPTFDQNPESALSTGGPEEEPVTNSPEEVLPETAAPEWEAPESDAPESDAPENEEPVPNEPAYSCYVMLSGVNAAAGIYGKDETGEILRLFEDITGNDDCVLEGKPDEAKELYTVSIVYEGVCSAYRLYDGYLLSLSDWNYYSVKEEQRSELYILLGIE